MTFFAPPPSSPSSDWLRTLPVAHRGLHRAPDRPENSLAAFRAARDAGFAIELDVHATRDGEIVVFHDDDLQRLCGHPGKIADLTLAELAPFRLLGTDEGIPTLLELLREIGGSVPLLIEVKRARETKPYEAEVLNVLKGYPGLVALQSFHPASVRYFKKHAPELPRGILSYSFEEEKKQLHALERILLRYVLLWPWIRPTFIAYDIASVPERWIPALCRALGAPLLFWTIRTPEQIEKARRLGGNLIFEGVIPT